MIELGLSLEAQNVWQESKQSIKASYQTGFLTMQQKRGSGNMFHFVHKLECV